MTQTAEVEGQEYKISEQPMEPADQMSLIRIGRMVEKEYPGVEFKSMDDIRLCLNKDLGINIRTGMKLGHVATMIFNGRLHRAHRDTYGIV